MVTETESRTWVRSDWSYHTHCGLVCQIAFIIHSDKLLLWFPFLGRAFPLLSLIPIFTLSSSIHNTLSFSGILVGLLLYSPASASLEFSTPQGGIYVILCALLLCQILLPCELSPPTPPTYACFSLPPLPHLIHFYYLQYTKILLSSNK